MILPEKTTFPPHKHFARERHDKDYRPQESWVVIQGKVRCIFYDIDDQILTTRDLEQGDASFTLMGGHTYEILEPNTMVYEFKTGKYEGIENDKIMI